MILRVSESLSRGLVVLAAIVVAATLSYFSVRTAVAARAAERETASGLETAIRLEPSNPDYWYRIGHFQQFNLEELDSSLAALYLGKAIALNPLYTNAWLDLGTNYELEGNTKAAREAFLQAKISYPSSAEVAWRYGNFLLREGELPTAYAEIQLAVRLDPHRAATAFSRCYRANPDIDAILNQALPADPVVYVDVLGEAARSKQLSVAQTVWERLLVMHPRLHFRDFDPFVSELLAAGRAIDGRRVWDEGVATMTLPALQRAKDSVVWDPSFESGAGGYFFSWRYPPLTQGAQVSLDSLQKHSGSQSLRLTFDGKRNPNLEPACTTVNVEPNTAYHFSGWVRTQELTTNSGIGFRIYSIGDPTSPVNQTSEIHGTFPWTNVDMPWTSGPKVHQARICIVREPSDTPNTNISGTAWVDDVNLVPQSAEPEKP
jgi:tetratricopeptide (TPR) repeat protein